MIMGFIAGIFIVGVSAVIASVSFSFLIRRERKGGRW